MSFQSPLTPRSTARVMFLLMAALNVAGSLAMDLAGPDGVGRVLAQATKPFLMPLLALCLYVETRGRPAAGADGFRPQSLYLALFFGWVGDVLLMLPERLASRLPQGAFAWGAGAFFLGHLCYIHVFLRGLTAAEVLRPSRLMYALPLLVYGYVLFLALDGFLGPMALPVAVYTGALLANGFAAYSRWSAHRALPASWCLLGALLFMQSDSILAVNQFIFVQGQSRPMPLANFAIMVTYLLGQFLLVHGSVLEAYGGTPVRAATEPLWAGNAASRS